MTFLKVDEIESALVGLHNFYPFYTELLPLPNKTYLGFQSHALLIRANPDFNCRPALIFVSGVHAREWGGPDILVNLAADLLEAYSTNAGLAYGGKSFNAATIRAIVNRTDIVVFPDQNPDGRALSMSPSATPAEKMWRKNRNPASSGGDPLKVGVDINRNYDFLWNFPVTFAPNVWPASNDPASETFFGTGPFSEPESRNAQWLVDHFPNARYFVDVHSYTGRVMHPWGDDENQTTDPLLSFMNVAKNGQRGRKGDAYGEYLPATRLLELQAAVAAMHDGIWAVRGMDYRQEQGFSLYPTSGDSEDWAFSREFLAPGRGKLGGFVIEFNKNIDFFPTWGEMQKLIEDIDAGLLALCERARPSWLAVLWCWLKRHFWAIWKRLWPWELWGPYGPWDRIKQVVRDVLGRVVKIAGGVFRRGGGG